MALDLSCAPFQPDAPGQVAENGKPPAHVLFRAVRVRSR